MKPFSSGPAFSGGSSGSKKKHHKNRKRTSASKRKKRRERANSLASADGSVGGGLSSSSPAQTSAVGRPTLSSGSQSSSKTTPAHVKANGKHGGGPSSSERLSFSAEESPAASASFGGSHHNTKKKKNNKSKSGNNHKKGGDEDTPTTTTPSTRDTTPSRDSSSSSSGGGGGQKHKHGSQIDQTAAATSQHRHIDFVYPRGKSPFGKKKQGGEPELFVFSSQLKKQKKKGRAYSYDGSSDGDGEEKKMDRADDDDDDDNDNDDLAFGGGRRRPRASTEESIDDIFAKLTPAKSKKTKPKKEEEDAADATAARKDAAGSNDTDKTGKEKKKRKRKRSMSAGSVGEAGISPSTASHVSSATKGIAKESSLEEEEGQHEKKRRKKKESRKVSMDDIDEAQDMSGGAKMKEAKARKEQRTDAGGGDGGLTHCSDDISHARPAQLHRQLSGRSVEDAVRDKKGRRPRSNSTDRELNLPSGGLCDERGVLGSHKWDAERMYGSNGKMVTRLLRADPLGFVNKGNTCYLNATLQCLAHLPTFCQCVTELPENDRSDGQGGKGKRMTKLIRALLREAHRLDEGRGGHNRGYISPGAIVKNLKLLSSSNRGYKFRPGRQEDAHEFLVHLLDAMNDGELRAAGIDQNQSGWRDRLPFPRLDETTFIHRIFGGYLRSQVRCTRCNYKSNTYDPFLDLALEVNKKDSVERAFRDFTRAETLDVDNQWKCSGCKKRVCAKKQLTVFRPPLSLVIQLKRFTFGGGGMLGGIMPFGRGSGFGYGHFAGKGMGMKGRGGSKITKPIAFPKVLNLPLSDERLCVYELTGVVIHVGGSATSGHYTAYVKKLQADGSYQWFYLDDSHVDKVSEKTVLRQKNAYLLFYCRKEVTMELPSPPPRKSSMSGVEAKEAGAQRARVRADSLSSLTPSPPTSSKKKAPSTPKPPSSSSSLSSSSSASSSSSDESEDNANLKGAKKNLDSSLSKAGSFKLTASKRQQSDEPSVSSDDSDDSDDSSYSGSGSSSSFSFDSSDIEEHSDASSNSGDQSDSSNSGSSASSSSSQSVEDTEEDDRNKKTKQQAPTSKKPKVATSTTGTGGSKIEVKVNRKKAKKAWQPSTLSSKERHNKSGRSDLLGNLNIGRWDDEEDDGAGTAGRSDDERYDNAVVSSSMRRRQKAVQEMNAKEKSKKRKMYLDSWDAALDEGKQKKVKEPKEPDEYDDPSPGANKFQRIQEETQRMYQGKAKGYHGTPGPKMPRRKNRKTYGSKDNNRRRSSHF